MNKFFSNRLILIFLLIILLVSSPYASHIAKGKENGEPRYDFRRNDLGYTFNGSFSIHADPRCLLDILFEYDHFIRIMAHANDFKRLEHGEDWYKLTYTFNKLFYEARPVFLRRIDHGARKVWYRLVRIEQKGLFTPEIVSIEGYYGVLPENGGYRVTFFQEGRVASRAMSGIFMNIAKKQAESFLEEMRAYALNHCS